MKLFIIAAVLGACTAGRLDNTYLPPNAGGSNFGQAGNSFGQASGFGQRPNSFGQSQFGHSGTQYSGNVYNAPSQSYNARPQSSADANAQILRSNSEVTAEGFSYDFETSNGIRADASGVATNGVQSHGSFGYKGDDGQDYSITYTADENGYRPQGAHLPTPPPIPEAILKSLEQNARDEAAGISDDGAYHGEGAGSGYSGNRGYSAPQAPSTQYGAPSTGFQSPRPNNFGATSRAYLTPNAGPARGSGNFNHQTGYTY